jgi:hypothetical protein
MVVAMDAFIITCEHGGNRIPTPYRRLFRGQGALLDSHRGYDPGSLVMAKALASACRAPLVASTTSRLLIDLNRSIGHPQLFSAVTRGAAAETRAQIVEHYYRPYRAQVERLVGQAVSRPSGDPHFVAQLYRGAGWQGARRRRGFALPPWSPRGGPRVCPLEGIARGIGSGPSRAPQLPLCGQRRRVDLAFALALRAERLRRNRVGSQPAHSFRRGPALDGVAAHAGSFITHGMYRLSAT